MLPGGLWNVNVAAVPCVMVVSSEVTIGGRSVGVVAAAGPAIANATTTATTGTPSLISLGVFIELPPCVHSRVPHRYHTPTSSAGCVQARPERRVPAAKYSNQGNRAGPLTTTVVSPGHGDSP